MEEISGARAFARMIRTWAAGPAFHVPGEGILEPLDALLQEGTPLVSCRHEAGAAVAAQAAGHVSGRPGICLVGRAPGALNAALALHTARTDGAPMILVMGQPSRRLAGREPFLGADVAQTFGASAKWVGICDRADRLVELMSRAWDMAMRGQRGPVVLAIHEEVWDEMLVPATLPAIPPSVPDAGPASEGGIARIRDALSEAARPLIIAGGTSWTPAGREALVRLAEGSGIPVVTAYRRRDLMPAAHPLFAGELGIGADPELTRQVAGADAILVLGMRLAEINTFGAGIFEGYRLLAAPTPGQPVFHVHPDPDELNAAYRTEGATCADPGTVAAQLLADPWPRGARDGWAAGLRAARDAFTEGRPGKGPVDLRAVFGELRAALPDDAMLTVGAGAYAHWPQRHFPHEAFGTQLGPKSGAMGYGLPAAIGVQAACPGRRVVAVAGDGCFAMQGEELATAVLHEMPIIVIVLNNSLYGAIAASQGRMFGRRTGVALAPVDFAALARAVGARGIRVESTAEFAPALRDALAARGPSLIEIVTTEEALKP